MKNNTYILKFIEESSNKDSYYSWAQAVDYCQSYPGQHFVHHKLTLSFKHGLFHIDTIGKSERVEPLKIVEHLETNYPFLQP